MRFRLDCTRPAAGFPLLTTMAAAILLFGATFRFASAQQPLTAQPLGEQPAVDPASAAQHSSGAAETLLLWPEGAPGAGGSEEGDQPRLILYRATAAEPTAAVVICPGGGYGHLAMDHEGHQIAAWLNSLNITAGICQYRHRGAGNGGRGYGHPAPMQDAQRAIRLMRAKASEWNVDPTRIGVIGFSAGGHLASTVSTHFDPGHVDDADRVQRFSSRPDFSILCYPVIALDKPYTHRGSQRNLLGESPDQILVNTLSNETRVTDQTPPTFLWHTSEDTAVPPENSVQYYLALHRHQVPAELHIFERGSHGLGLAAKTPDASRWPELCATWLRVHGVTVHTESSQ